MKILQERKAQIRQALQEASVAHKQKDYDTALKLLEPYKKEKRVAFAIGKIQNAMEQGSSSKKKRVRVVEQATEQEWLLQLKKHSTVLMALVSLSLCAVILFSMNSLNPSAIPEIMENFTSGGTLYTANSGNVRTCADPSCERLIVLPAGEPVTIIERVEGVSVSDTTLWYHVILSDGREGYMHGELLSEIRPTRVPTRVPSVNDTGSSNNVNPAPVQNQWNCSRNTYDCSSFSSCSQVMSYWNSCPNDPSSLDGDNDGRPCERIC